MFYCARALCDKTFKDYYEKRTGSSKEILIVSVSGCEAQVRVPCHQQVGI